MTTTKIIKDLMSEEANKNLSQPSSIKEQSIFTAIIDVMSEIGYVQKGGKVSFGSTQYSYASEADLIAAVRPAMIKVGITFHCAKIDIIQTSPTLMCMYSYVFTHAESGSCIEVQVIGEGKDLKGDKASYMAATGALKYALRQTFVMETGDDPDKTSSEEHQATEEEKKEKIKQERKKKEQEEAKRKTEQLETINNINSMIEKMADSNKVEMVKMLDVYSSYTDPALVFHKGVKTFRGISNDQLAATFKNVQRAYAEWKKDNLNSKKKEEA